MKMTVTKNLTENIINQMEEWEHQIVELKSSLRSKDSTILRLRKYIEVYKVEFDRREVEYQHESMYIH
jgi:hypothetical protein